MTAVRLRPRSTTRSDVGLDDGRTRAPLRAGPLDADLGDALAAGRYGPVPRTIAEFEQRFVTLVEASGPHRDRAWDGFYDRTLARVSAGWDGAGAAGGDSADRAAGTVASFTRIWAEAVALHVGGSALDVGTCFGFLPLAWAARPGAPRLAAFDLSPASAALTARQARRLGRAVAVACADGTALPLADQAVDTVLVLHVLEHVDATTSGRLLAEALRVAARRVVVAVPVEAEPDLVFGHLQVFDVARLVATGADTGWLARVFTSDGAWLVLDRP